MKKAIISNYKLQLCNNNRQKNFLFQCLFVFIVDITVGNDE